ncbi:MAG: lipoyl synthase [Deltaproteobacteria bacterium]|nr:lipoyl synthase [Deltaproteobacteria bacterium]
MTVQRLPDWVTNRAGTSEATHQVKRILRAKGLHTVCESALCPNQGECFARETATFMILGDHCTRDCAFCAVGHERPGTLDAEEPMKIAAAVRELHLKHVVITSVTRDDLSDGGSLHFSETVRVVKSEVPGVTVEILTPDFGGDREAIRVAAVSGADIYNHNVETVPRLYPEVRSRADYRRSLDLLFYVKWCATELPTKSGFMLGFGEQPDEVISVMRDLRDVGCEILTIGQYLRPRKKNVPVVEYVPQERFAEYERIGYELGFQVVMSGPLVRSSFHADEAMTVLGKTPQLFNKGQHTE